MTEMRDALLLYVCKGLTPVVRVLSSSAHGNRPLAVMQSGSVSPSTNQSAAERWIEFEREGVSERVASRLPIAPIRDVEFEHSPRAEHWGQSAVRCK